MHGERGAALPAVLFALAVASALAVGGVYVARQLAASGRHAQRAVLLQAAAEMALVDAVVDWDSAGRADQALGASAEIAPSETPAIRTERWITRYNSTGYWIVAESGFRQGTPLKRRAGVLVSASGGAPEAAKLRAWSELP
jgi:hypothetical protein